MDEAKLIEKLARRVRVPRATARAVLGALHEILQEEGVSKHALLSPGSTRSDDTDRIKRAPTGPPAHSHHSDPHVVDELITRARSHELGIEFLLNGFLASVAAEFGAHAFTIEAARQRLRTEKRNGRVSSRNS